MRVYSTIAGLKPRHSAPMFLEAAGPEALLRKSDLTARWCRREMSNFDYIMVWKAFKSPTESFSFLCTAACRQCLKKAPIPESFFDY
jgi:hypothetical protein